MGSLPFREVFRIFAFMEQAADAAGCAPEGDEGRVPEGEADGDDDSDSDRYSLGCLIRAWAAGQNGAGLAEPDLQPKAEWGLLPDEGKVEKYKEVLDAGSRH